jgi:hypothetical protein
MPLEIRELIIRAEVTPAKPGGGRGGGPQLADPRVRERLIRECVEQVLEILKERKEP